MTIKLLFRNITVLFMLLCTTIVVKAADYPVSDPDNSGGWTLNEHLSDEFDGTELDKEKWWILGENNDYRNKWKGRAPGQFAPHNVVVEGGELKLISQWDNSFTFANEQHEGTWYGGSTSADDNSQPISQACIMSERFFKYGYMEIRCQIADAPVTCAFWTTGYHGEIDMIENYGKRPIDNPENKSETLEKKYRTNLISWDPDRASDHQNWKVEDVMTSRLAADYHVYGFEWDRNYIKTYFDGELIREATFNGLASANRWQYDQPQELWLDTEVFSWYGLPSAQDLAIPAEYKIDYVRIWQKELSDHNFNGYGFEGPFHFQGRSVNWWGDNSTGWRIKSDRTNTIHPTEIQNQVASGDFSLRFYSNSPVTSTHTIFSPNGSLDVDGGTFEMKFKIWIDPNTTLNEIDFILDQPWKILTFDLSNVAKGQWVELKKTYSRSATSSTSLTSGDRVRIRLQSGDAPSSEVLFFIDDIDLGFEIANSVNDNIDNSELSVFPNPADNIITIDAEQNGTITLYNNAGSIVKTTEKTTTQSTIDVSNLPSGIYFVMLSGQQGTFTQKVVIE